MTEPSTSFSTPPAFVLKPSEAGNVLLRSLQRFYLEKKLFDVSISCNGRTLFGCHKLVLASCSSYFESLLSDTDGFAILNLDAVDSDYVKHLNIIVDFMYGHNIVAPRVDSLCRQLYEAARIFGVTALIKTMDVQLSSTGLLKNGSKSTVLSSDSSVGRGAVDGSSKDGREEVIELKPCGIGPMLLVNFQRFKNDTKFIDAKICCRDQLLFTCHKLVLASFSAYFESLLSSTEGSAILNLDAVDTLYINQLSTIIGYMYGNATWVKADDVDLLRDAAIVFGVQALEAGDLEKMRQRKEQKRLKRSLTEKLDKLRNGPDTTAPRAKRAKKNGNDSNGTTQTAGQLLKAPVGTSQPTGNRSINAGDMAQSQTSTGASEEIISQGSWNNAAVTINAPPTLMSPSEFLERPISPSASKAKEAAAAQVLSNIGLLSAQTLCPKCGKTFRKNTMGLRSHLLKHQIPTSWNIDFENDEAAASSMKCAECFDIFKDIPSLRTHWESVHGELQDERGCFQCGLVFCDKAALRQHSILAHGAPRDAESEKKRASKRKSSTVKASKKTNKLTCRGCGFTSTSLTNFMTHVDQEHGTNDSNCQACGLSFPDRQTLNMHYHEAHNLAMYLCKICGKVFKTLPGFKNHKETHGENHRCESCSFTTKTKRNLHLHVKKYHPDVSSTSDTESTMVNDQTKDFEHLPHKCPDCPAAFLYECYLTRHYQSRHLKLKPFTCPHCGYSTAEKATLQTHVRCMHTNEAPYSCDVCGFKCKTYSILTRHRRVHTGEKPHVCEECGAAFPEKRDLTAHSWKVHVKVRPFKCNICNVGFFRKDNLLQHERSKHGQRN